MLILCGFTKNPVYRGGGVTKNWYIGEICLKKGGAGTVCRFKAVGTWQKSGGAFEGDWWGGWYPNTH